MLLYSTKEKKQEEMDEQKNWHTAVNTHVHAMTVFLNIK
jgi:hypothetical protein